VALRDSVSIRLGLRRVKLVRHGLTPLSAEQERVNHRVALELDGASDWFDARDGAELASLLGSGAGEEHGTASARSEWMRKERLRDELERALRHGDVLAEEPEEPRPPKEREEPPPELPPAPRKRSLPPEPAAPEPDLPAEPIDQELQARTLVAAAQAGSPFCEECQKARQAAGAA